MLEFTDSDKTNLELLKEKYKLSKFEYINLVSLILTKRIMTKEKEDSRDIDYFINLIVNNRERPIINDNTGIYKSAVAYIVTRYYQDKGINETSYYNIMNNWLNGYAFHSLNSVFVKEINSNGFKLDNKPWDMEEIKRMRKLLNGTIFGLFNGNNGVYFASDLAGAPYYGLSSPTFYRKFVENKREYLNIFLNRNLTKAHESIERLCEEKKLTEEEKEEVMHFFKKYWLMFDTDELPCVILRRKEAREIPPYPSSNVVSMTIDMLNKKDNNKYVTHDISRDEIEIFSYETLGSIKQYQDTIKK